MVNDNLPYLVLLDGDYAILSGGRSIHRHVVRLDRYSFENYLWESEVINRACHRAACSGDRTDIAGPEFDRINQHLANTLHEMVEVDVAARRSDPAPKVLPDRVDRLLVDARRPEICPHKVANIIKAVLPSIEAQALP